MTKANIVVIPKEENDLYGKEPMHVYLRVRPLTTTEIEKNESKDCVSIQDSCSVLVKAPQTSLTGRLSDKARAHIAQNFTFTQVFGPETSQTQFFDGTMKQQVMDFMEGQNHLLFTYGVTNAGKTFTFQDLQWIQVSDAKEACRILALGKKFQSTACTKLNSLSSRSHSIFTVRLLKIKDANNPQVIKVSELSLCDLAGSERCTKTQNVGERLRGLCRDDRNRRKYWQQNGHKFAIIYGRMQRPALAR
ncbi:kinesin-like protein KIF20B [Ascaphus truei]|uniref:kinesin-like protein KIF20B n=1 Tax=Ascaphus truei TaxID=8439 RepID=UPI003F593CAC